MMKIVFHRPENCMLTVSKKFSLLYDQEWMNDPEVQQMVQDIDNTKLLNPAAAYSPILGSISVDQLSGGVKGLIMIKHDMERRAYSSCIFGDNCAEWLARLSFEVDFTFYSQHSFLFSHGLERGGGGIKTGELLR